MVSNESWDSKLASRGLTMGFMSMAGTAVEENGDCVRVGLLLLFLLFQLLRGPERDLKSEQPQTRDGGVKMARTDASGVLDRNRPRQVEWGSSITKTRVVES